MILGVGLTPFLVSSGLQERLSSRSFEQQPPILWFFNFIIQLGIVVIYTPFGMPAVYISLHGGQLFVTASSAHVCQRMPLRSPVFDGVAFCSVHLLANQPNNRATKTTKKSIKKQPNPSPSCAASCDCDAGVVIAPYQF